MTRVRTRTIALAAAAIGAMVIAAAGFALKDAARERYSIWRLETGDEAARAAAIERLGEIGSARAIPALLEAFKTSIREKNLQAFNPGGGQIILPGGGQIITTRPLISGRPGLRQAALRLNGSSWFFLPQNYTEAKSSIGNAMNAIASRSFRRARRQLERGLEDESWEARFMVACVLYHLEGGPPGLDELLEKAARDENNLIRSAACEAIASRNSGEPAALEPEPTGEIEDPASPVIILPASFCPICGDLHGARWLGDR